MRIRAFVVLTALLLVPAASAPAQESPDTTVPTAGSIDFGGQFSSMNGDEARFQRYKDLRTGGLLDAFRYTREKDELAVQRDRELMSAIATRGSSRRSATTSGRASRSPGTRSPCSIARRTPTFSDPCRRPRIGVWVRASTGSTTRCSRHCRRSARHRRARPR